MATSSEGRRAGDRLHWAALVTGVAVVLGGIGALVTVGFVKLLERLIDLLWVDLPDALDVSATGAAFVLPVCVAGGVAVGLCARYLGDWPEDLETALADFRRDRTFDYRHLPNSLVAALVALTFGGALGPEAALVALVGGLGSWITHTIGLGARAAGSLEYVGLTSALGTLFGTAGAAALPFEETETPVPPRRWMLLLPGLAAAGAGALVFRALSSGRGYFDYDFRPYDFAVADLGYAIAAAVAGVAVTLAFLTVSRLIDVPARRLDARPVLRGALGGAGLGLLASASALVLFSGHAGIQDLLDDPGASTGFLVGIAAAKIGATALLLATGWRGGRFFPLLFAGAAGGLAFAVLLPDDAAMVGLAAAMTAAIAALIRRPVAAGLLMLFLFPSALYPTVVIAAILGSLIGRWLVRRRPALDEVGA